MKNFKKTMNLLKEIINRKHEHYKEETNKLFSILQYDKNDNLTLNSIFQFHYAMNFGDYKYCKNADFASCMLLCNNNFIKFKNIIINYPENKLLKNELETCFKDIKLDKDGDVTLESYNKVMLELSKFESKIYVGDVFTQLGII